MSRSETALAWLITYLSGDHMAEARFALRSWANWTADGRNLEQEAERAGMPFAELDRLRTLAAAVIAAGLNRERVPVR